MSLPPAPSFHSSLPFAGRFAHFFHHWTFITSDASVLQTVQGLPIKFTSQRHSSDTPSNSPLLSPPTLSGTLHPLPKRSHQMSLGLTRLPQPYVFARKKSDDFRPVMNLKVRNSFVLYCHFKMKGIHLLRDLLQDEDWLTRLDLKDTYLTFPVHTSYISPGWITHGSSLASRSVSARPYGVPQNL